MIRLAYASFLESRGEIDQARGIYTSFLEGHAGHMEVVYKYALFELRQKNVDKTVEILSNAEEAAEDTVSKGFFRAQKIKLAFKSSKDVEGTRDAYKVAGDEYADSRSIWTEWLLFEIAQSTADSDSVKIVWDALSASTLAPETKALLGRKYADFLLEQGAPVADLINVDVQISFVSREIEVPSVAGGASNSPPRKRAMDTGAFSASKQARLEGDLSSQTSVNA